MMISTLGLYHLVLELSYIICLNRKRVTYKIEWVTMDVGSKEWPYITILIVTYDLLAILIVYKTYPPFLS